MKKYLSLIAIVLMVFLLPGVAFMSGAFCGQYADSDFTLYYEDEVRKIFVSAEQSDDYFAGKRERFIAEHVPVFAAIREVLAASGKKINILPMDPTLKEFAEHGKKNQPRYPCVYTMEFQADLGRYRISITLGKAPLPAELKCLRNQLEKALNTIDEETESMDTAANMTQVMEPEMLIKDRYALYALFAHDMHPENDGRFRKLLKNIIQEAENLLENQLAEKSFGQSLGARPLPVGPVIEEAKTKGYTEEMIFRPRGPGVADDLPGLVSLRQERGQAILVVLMAFEDYDWGKVSTTVRQLFEK